MMYEDLQGGQINVLVSEADWAWPVAVQEFFEPRGVSMMLARRPGDVLEILCSSGGSIRRLSIWIPTNLNGMGTIRIIRARTRCCRALLLAQDIEQRVLSKALELDVFSVIGKPVDFDVLQGQLDRLFTQTITIVMCLATKVKKQSKKK